MRETASRPQHASPAVKLFSAGPAKGIHDVKTECADESDGCWEILNNPIRALPALRQQRHVPAKKNVTHTACKWAG